VPTAPIHQNVYGMKGNYQAYYGKSFEEISPLADQVMGRYAGLGDLKAPKSALDALNKDKTWK